MRTLDQSCGVNMNTWFVGNVPIGHYQYEFPKEYANPDRKYIGKKVFFMKCRILAGQADLENNTRDLEDFMWLTKEEIKEQVSGNYYGNVRHMLVSN